MPITVPKPGSEPTTEKDKTNRVKEECPLSFAGAAAFLREIKEHFGSTGRGVRRPTVGPDRLKNRAVMDRRGRNRSPLQISSIIRFNLF